jgi:imidazole glycerol-phosphate synthase subunit HisH
VSLASGGSSGVSPKVVVLDYGSGNVHSVAKALQAAGAEVSLTGNFDDALAAEGLVVPGVGAFDAVMKQLGTVKAAQIIDQRLTMGKKVLGICVGLQVMFESGNEHGIETDGLGQWPGKVELLPAPVLPHMGWNTVKAPAGSKLFEGIADERFYFVHSYGVLSWPLADTGEIIPTSVTWGEYGAPFIAAVENGPLSATQFHPEKSGQAGIRLLTNWVNTL